ncbi:hypothetical protein MKY51_15705 [Solibacillus sp. FSL R5-0691]|uniref:hypothetical protein n=1 Tax=Solibacillus sp. FSL R5-0691 TaxID=2921653 RepID=UPI0030CF2EFA
MKIIRCYAATATAVNVQNVIQDLLLIKFETLINESHNKDNKCNLIQNKEIDHNCEND